MYYALQELYTPSVLREDLLKNVRPMEQSAGFLKSVQVYNLYSALVFIICSSSYLSSEVDRSMKNAMNGSGITVLDGRGPCIVEETSMLALLTYRKMASSKEKRGKMLHAYQCCNCH